MNNLDIGIKKCSECEYNLRCKECALPQENEDLKKIINQYQKGFDDGYSSFANDFYTKLVERCNGYNPNVLVRMSDITKILISVKAGEK